MATVLERGEIAFSIESRLIRELGERLVRQPEVALLELIKNAYDADATRCEVRLGDGAVEVEDDGHGMTHADFADGWMRIGTDDKGGRSTSRLFRRPVTGEKGIGRFAVRHLGGTLGLDTVAYDGNKGFKTRLVARFEWERFDRQSDLDDVKIPFTLAAAPDGARTGTILTIGALKPSVAGVDWRALRTGSRGVFTPISSLLHAPARGSAGADGVDPGFELVSFNDEQEVNLGDAVLARYALKALLVVKDGRLDLTVHRSGEDGPHLAIKDDLPGSCGDVRSEIRFFPRRAGLLTRTGLDGRRAYTWIRENSGVKVFDRDFQVRPYGMEGDDWLDLTQDAARNLREPVSPIMAKHFPMSQEVKQDPALNWMLRLPDNKQLIGVVQVDGRGTIEAAARARKVQGGPAAVDEGLVAAADREGFLTNDAFRQLRMLVRAAVEAIAYADREISLKDLRLEQEQKVEAAREETKRAIASIEADRTLTMPQRARIVEVLEETQDRADRQRAGSREREQQLEVMSLLGVVAGFMTHEFGVALSELRDARAELAELAKEIPGFSDRVVSFDKRIATLRSFVTYSKAYVRGAKIVPDKPYRAKPRFDHVVATFGKYAADRRIAVEIDVEAGLLAPPVPPSLYDGITQNLYTNALKALTASTREQGRRIVFRAWNEARWHHLQVSDNGVGVPDAIRDLVFDPLFTTTDRKSSDPLGSGMGLGLAMVRRGAAAFGGAADLVDPPPGLTTCVEVRLPRAPNE